MSDYFIGLDLGQKRDFTALAIVERIASEPSRYNLRHVERIALGTSYTAVVEQVWHLATKCGYATLIMDATGVGAAVCDLFRQSGKLPIRVTITGGNSEYGADGAFCVPKRNLIRSLLSVLESGRMKIAEEIPFAVQLVQELLDFKVQINPRTRRESYEAGKASSHDDLIVALALAAWFPEYSCRNKMKTV